MQTASRKSACAVCLVYLSLAGGVASAGPWKAVVDSARDLIRETSAGIELLDTQGDPYADSNTQKSVFLRQPARKPPYAVEATVNGTTPLDTYSQAGLVAWRDADNYVRISTGFDHPGAELLGEFNGKPVPRGMYPLYPSPGTDPIRLRMEVLEHSVRGYASRDGLSWLRLGGVTLPAGKTCPDFFSGIGVLGIGGKMQVPPSITGWTESAMTETSMGANLLASPDGWFRVPYMNGDPDEQARLGWKNSGLQFTSMSGSDLYFGLERYPYISRLAPAAQKWCAQLRISQFNAAQPGAYIKAGIVIWQDNQTFIAWNVVSDKQFHQAYLETLVSGGVLETTDAATGTRQQQNSMQTGFRGLDTTDITLRITRESANRYSLSGSYDGKNWMDLKTVIADLPEPQVRLFLSGDIYVQSPSHPPTARFESFSLLPEADAR